MCHVVASGLIMNLSLCAWHLFGGVLVVGLSLLRGLRRYSHLWWTCGCPSSRSQSWSRLSSCSHRSWVSRRRLAFAISLHSGAWSSDDAHGAYVLLAQHPRRCAHVRTVQINSMVQWVLGYAPRFNIWLCFIPVKSYPEYCLRRVGRALAACLSSEPLLVKRARCYMS